MTAERITCYIGLGSNLENPLQQVTAAVEAIKNIENTQLIQLSPWIESYAVGPGEQPNFVNGVVEITTQLAPEVLLKKLQNIEQQANRKRVIRWGARTLDLDILLYGQAIINTEQVPLTVPHSHLKERDFVVIPLLSLAPDLVLPCGQSLSDVGDILHIENGRTVNCWPLEPLK